MLLPPVQAEARGGVGRCVPAIPAVKESEVGEEYDYEGPSGYGYTRDSNEYVERRGGTESGSQSQGSGNKGRGRKTVEEILKSSEQSGEKAGEEGACGPECRNLVHESEEDAVCPYERMVIDIWGYSRSGHAWKLHSCSLSLRYQFEEEQ